MTRFNKACCVTSEPITAPTVSIRLTVLVPIVFVIESTTAALSLGSRLRVRIITSLPDVSAVVSPES